MWAKADTSGGRCCHHDRPLGRKGQEQGGGPVCCCASPPETWAFPRIKEGGGQTLSSLTFSGVVPPTDRGYNGAPAQHYLAGGAGESGGTSPWVCSVSGNGVSARGPGEAALRAAVSEGLALGSQGSKGSIFSFFWGQLPVWERKQKEPWQEMVFFLQPLFQ